MGSTLPNFVNDGFHGPQTKSFYYKCVPIWNKLPSDVVAAQSIKSFKEKLNDAEKNKTIKTPIRKDQLHKEQRDMKSGQQQKFSQANIPHTQSTSLWDKSCSSTKKIATEASL